MFAKDSFIWRCESQRLRPDLSTSIQASCVMVHQKELNLGPMTVHGPEEGQKGEGGHYHKRPISWYLFQSLIQYCDISELSAIQHKPASYKHSGWGRTFIPTTSCSLLCFRYEKWMSLIFFKTYFSSVNVEYTPKIVVSFWTRQSGSIAQG
jgi:hypothetical protein